MYIDHPFQQTQGMKISNNHITTLVSTIHPVPPSLTLIPPEAYFPTLLEKREEWKRKHTVCDITNIHLHNIRHDDDKTTSLEISPLYLTSALRPCVPFSLFSSRYTHTHPHCISLVHHQLDQLHRHHLRGDHLHLPATYALSKNQVVVIQVVISIVIFILSTTLGNLPTYRPKHHVCR